MTRRRAIPLVVLALLVGAITIVFLQAGDPAPPAVHRGPLVMLGPHLRGLEDGPDGELSARTYVEATLDRVAGAPRAPILEALRHDDWGARWAGLLAVPRYGPPDAALADALEPLLADESLRVRRLAAGAAAFLGEDYATIEPALERAARDPEVGVRAEALATLARRTTRGDTLWSLFADALADDDASVRAAAAKGLARIELAERLPPRVVARLRRVLVGALDDATPDVRMYAVMALGRAGAQAAPEVPAMLALLADESTLVRGTASNALGDVGPAALPALREALARADAELAASLLWALRLIGPEALPALREALDHAVPVIRVQAALKLWELEQPPGPVIAVLSDALQGRDRDAARLAARGFARMGTAGAAARDLLARNQDHPDEVVREAVRSALARIDAGG